MPSKSNLTSVRGSEKLLHDVEKYRGRVITGCQVVRMAGCQVVFEVEGLPALVVPVERSSIAEWCERLLTEELRLILTEIVE